MTSSLAASVRLDTHFHVGPVDRRIFGGFLEHLGRAVCEGVYDPGSPLADERGFRTDVLAALRPLRMPIMRYPGGNYVSACDWKDGIGLRASRPRRPDYAWQSVESNQFGNDEFIAWCRELDCQPMLAVNLGTSGAAEAAQYVEYCNLQSGTFWADKRVANGNREPFGVKTWCLGNEMDGPWQAGQSTAEVYAWKARQASALMKGLDRSISTVACGSSSNEMPTYMSWDRTVLDICWDTVDLISAHRYSHNHPNDSAWFLAEGMEIEQVIREYRGLVTHLQGQKRSRKQIYLSFDEWNVWYRARSGSAVEGGWASAPHLLEEEYNLEDALVCAQYLMAFIRNADFVKMACLAQIVNVIAPIMTSATGLRLQTIYHAIALISGAARGNALTPAVTSPSYSAGKRGEVPALDAAATYDPDTRELTAILVNRNPHTPLTVDLHLSDLKLQGTASARVLTGPLKQTNTWQDPRAIAPGETVPIRTEAGLRLHLPAPGLAVMKITATKR